MLKAIALYDSLSRLNDKAETLIFLGEILYFDEKYSIALKYLQEAENIAHQIGDKTLLAQSYEIKAIIYLDGLADKKSGKSYLLKSNAILLNADKLNILTQNYISLATFHLENKNIDSLLFFIEKGEITLNKTENIKSNAKIYFQHSLTSLKGTGYARIGKLDTAKSFIEQSLPFFLENENWYDVAWS